MTRILYALLALGLLLSHGSAATLDQYGFVSTGQREHFKGLIAELRCLVCQNQSLADSDAPLAEDLRREVYQMMQAGRTDAEIIDFLVARYGDFVLYRPPIKATTYLLWFGPFLLLALAVALVLLFIRRRAHQPAPELTPTDHQRLQQLLNPPAVTSDRSYPD